MRQWVRISVLALMLLVPILARAEQPQCPLEIGACLKEFGRLRTRPWLGVTLDNDSTGRMLVRKVLPGSPAYRAGVRAGDELRSIEGMPPAQWFASKAGWGPKERGKLAVLRGEREKELAMAYEAIPEEQFARIVGVHMLEGHLAYMPKDVAEEQVH